MRLVDLLGINIWAVDIEGSLRFVVKHIKNEKGAYFCFANFNLIMEASRDPALRYMLNQSAGNFADGMAVAWALKILGNDFEGRVRGTDFMLKLCAYSAQNELRVFLYGNTPGTLNVLRQKLTQSFLGIQIVGQISPPFRDLSTVEEDTIVRRINKSEPDILFVSLGAPKQEKWMGRNKAKIRAVQFGVGAAFDFITGNMKQAPEWMQRSGLEWLFRVPQQPSKTLKRMSLLPEFALGVLFQKLKKGNDFES